MVENSIINDFTRHNMFKNIIYFQIDKIGKL